LRIGPLSIYDRYGLKSLILIYHFVQIRSILSIGYHLFLFFHS
jgi:hypothetical protein